MHHMASTHILPLCLGLLFVKGDSLECGERNGAQFTRKYIYGGTPAPRSQWPWVVAIWKDGVHICGGALIDDLIILTAAHCIGSDDYSTYGVSVRAPGENESEIFEVESAVLHELFEPAAVLASRMGHDIAVVKLKDRPQTVTPICLPNDNTRTPSTISKCIVAGWGEIEDGQTTTSGHLRYVAVPIVSKSTCETEWGTSLNDSIICAGKYDVRTGQRRGSCAGDSGGPLTCQIGHKWYIFGVVSFGSEVCLLRPGAYANIKNLLPWIRKATHLLNNSQLITSNVDPTRQSRDCAEVKEGNPSAQSGVYGIWIEGRRVDVYCDMDIQGGGWTVIQRRSDGSVDFKRDWNTYADGFGDVSAEHWLGNENIQRMTSREDQDLLVELREWNRTCLLYALYSNFSLDTQTNNYTLSHVNYIKGTAGDSGKGLSWHSGVPFTTVDRDNDESSSRNCAKKRHGGWWYRDCYKGITHNLDEQFVKHQVSEFSMEWNPNVELSSACGCALSAQPHALDSSTFGFRSIENSDTSCLTNCSSNLCVIPKSISTVATICIQTILVWKKRDI